MRPRPNPLTLQPTGEDGLSGPPATCQLGLLSPAGSQGPTCLTQLTSFSLPLCLKTLPQPAVQGQELPQEASVGDDASVVLDFLDGLHEGEAVVQHEVGQHQGGRPAHSYSTMHQDLPCEDRHKRRLWDYLWWVGGH